MKNIYVLGSLNMDLAIESDKIPVKGETVTGSNFSTCPGGKGLNQAIAAAKLGAKVKMLGCIGQDTFGQQMFDALKKNSVDVAHIKVIKNVSSGIAMILLYKKDNRIILDLGANLKLQKKDVDEFLKGAQKGDVFLTQLENNLEIVGYALEIAKKRKMRTVVNPAPCKIGIKKYSKFIDVITPNSGELQQLLKYGKYQQKPDKLGISIIIETKGKDGYCCYKNKETISNKAPKVKVVDTTGAGDTFTGALCYQLSLEKEINKKTLDFASYAASISVTRKGSSVSSPALEEVEERFLQK